jgi:hypothetical protein
MGVAVAAAEAAALKQGQLNRAANKAMERMSRFPSIFFRKA